MVQFCPLVRKCILPYFDLLSVNCFRNPTILTQNLVLIRETNLHQLNFIRDHHESILLSLIYVFPFCTLQLLFPLFLFYFYFRFIMHLSSSSLAHFFSQMMPSSKSTTSLCHMSELNKNIFVLLVKVFWLM